MEILSNLFTLLIPKQTTAVQQKNLELERCATSFANEVFETNIFPRQSLSINSKS